MVKIIIEIEEKESISYHGVKAIGMNCGIEEINIKATEGEKEAGKELINKMTDGRKKSSIINKNKKDDKDVNELIDILKSWNL